MYTVNFIPTFACKCLVVGLVDTKGKSLAWENPSMLPSRPCATWLCKSEAMLRNCRLLLRFWTSALSKEEWRQLKDITGSRLTPWRGCQTRLITTMDTVSEEQQSVIQHTDTLPSVAGGVEESCYPKSKSCDGVASTSGIQDNTHARRYATEEGYEYLQRGHSTEIFKIIISNVPPKIGYSVSNFIVLELVNLVSNLLGTEEQPEGAQPCQDKEATHGNHMFC